MTDFEVLLFKKAAKGDTEAFGQFIVNYEKLIYTMACRMLSNPEDAKDISQEVIIKIFKNLDQCKEPLAFKSWMYKIINNTCFDELRRRKGKYTESLDARLDTGEGEMERQIPSGDETPEEALLKNETVQRVQTAIAMLRDHYKTLIILRDIEGLSYDEIARITGASLGTVKSRISRARSALKDILLKGGEQL